MQRQTAGCVWMCLDTAGYGWVGTLAMLERAACMLQHGELGRPFSRQLGPAGSRWVGQLSWVGPVGFHSRTTLLNEFLELLNKKVGKCPIWVD